MHVFVLEPGLDPALFGGSVALPGGRTFDVGKALRDGGGEIKADDPQLIGVLDGYHGVVLDRVEDDPAPADENLADLKKDQLVEHATGLGIDVPASATKADILALIEAGPTAPDDNDQAATGQQEG